MDSILVSIIMPVYNVALYLEEAIESIENQTYSNIQLIAVNDGSTDESLKILEEFQQKTNLTEFIILSQENKGLSAARNRGIPHMRGKYIYFFDSDDLIEEDMVKKCVETAENLEVDVVRFCSDSFVDGIEDDQGISFDVSLPLEENIKIERDEFLRKIGYTPEAPVWLYFYRSKLIKENSLSFKEGLIHEDELYTPLLIGTAKSVSYLGNSFFKRRVRANSIMTTQKNQEKKRSSEKLIIEELQKELLQQDYTEDMKLYIEQSKANIFRRFCALNESYSLIQIMNIKKQNMIQLGKKETVKIYLKGILRNCPQKSFLKKVVRKIKYCKKRMTLDDNLKKIKKEKNPYFLILSTPVHGNLGDTAIAYAEEKFLRTHFPTVKIFEIPTPQVVESLPKLKRILRKDAICFFHGGGNMGDIYPYEENIRRETVRVLKNKIISFPQSTSFEQDSVELIKSKNEYEKNVNWILNAREEISLSQMRSFFERNKILYTPDIVLSLAQTELNVSQKREGVITLLRDDIEKKISKAENGVLFGTLEENFKKVTKADTHIGEDKEVRKEEREVQLRNLWNKISSHEVVVTDRLHGMIFACITQTPVVVLSNNNHKIMSTYHSWLKESDSICFLNDVTKENLQKAISKLQNNKFKEIDLQRHYNPFLEEIRKKGERF